MSDEAGFLKSLEEQPAERTTRLAYADWLTEHDRPREAEFLKLQLQLADAHTRLLELGGTLNVEWLKAVANAPHPQTEIVLRSGRPVRLRGLNQRPVYGMFTLGAPTIASNQQLVTRFVATELEQSGREPYLVEPEQRPVELGTPDHPIRGRGLLPQILCVGTLASLKPARDESLVYSELTVIWFQQFLAFPIDPGVREQIRAIDWEKHAHDFDW
ncbi:MAG: TIGR02996 domain-containing protein [Gemmataceae bacterium]|nr:TIGR02996 domain-containing protein [Gemmataceae bacterium]